MDTEPTEQQFTGKFCWDEIEGVAVPFIIRSCGEMLAEINMLKKTLFRKHLEVLKQSIFEFACPTETQISRATVSERRLLNEINAVHCDYFFSKKPYTSDTFLLTKDLVIKLHEVLEVFHKVVTERSIENPKSGYILIDESNTPVPFVDVDGLGMVVPLFFFECPAVMHIKIALDDHWSLVYLKLFCKLLSVLDVFYDHPTLMVVKLDHLKDVIPEAGQITFITTLPSNAKLSEITKNTNPVKRRRRKATGEKSSPNTKRPASKLDNSTTAEVIVLSETDPVCDSRDALETITIEIEKDEETMAAHISEELPQRKQIRKKRKFQKMLPLPSKTAVSAERKTKRNECLRKTVRSKKRKKSNTTSVIKNKVDTLKSCEQELGVKQFEPNSIDDTANSQQSYDPNETPAEAVCYGQLMEPNATSVIQPQFNTLTPCYQNMQVKPIHVSDPSLLGTYQTCVNQTGNTSMEQNSFVSNTMLLPSLSNNDPNGTPCFGFLPQGPGIMSNDILQSNPSLVLSGTNNPVYVISPQSELMNGLASSPGIFLASGQPIVPPSFQKPNGTYSIIGTQDQPVMSEQQTTAPPSSINLGISNSVVNLQQQQDQSVGNQQPVLFPISKSIVDTMQQLGLFTPQDSSASQQKSSASKQKGVFFAIGRSEIIAVQPQAEQPQCETSKGSPTLSSRRNAPKNSKESIKKQPPKGIKMHSEHNEFITVFEKEPQHLYLSLQSPDRVVRYKITKMPEYVGLNRPLSYRIQKFRKRDYHGTRNDFICISCSPFDTGKFLINICEVREKLFPKVDNTIFFRTTYNMNLELFYLNSSQRVVFARRNKKSKRKNSEGEFFVILDQLSDVFVLLSNFLKMACRTYV